MRFLSRLTRRAPARAPDAVPLDAVRRRIELLVAAMYGRPILVEPAAPPAKRHWSRRVFEPVPRHLRSAQPLASAEGERIRLPATLDARDGIEAAIARFRLMAVEQAERLTRGTADMLPPDATQLQRDLYLLCESAAVDRAIATKLPGMRATLREARAAALARRPPLETLTPLEREVEGFVREVLASDPLSPPPAFEIGAPDASLARARDLASRMHDESRRYRGVAPVSLWGGRANEPLGGAFDPDAVRPQHPPNPFATRSAFNPIEARSLPGQGEKSDGRADAPPDDRGRKAESNARGAEAHTRSGGGAATGARAASPDAPASPQDAPPPGTAAAELGGTFDAEVRAGPAPAGEQHPTVQYPEWDHDRGRRIERAVTVHAAPAPEGDGGWASGMLARHAVLLRRVRDRFERLRARRIRLAHQRDGDDLDIAACIRALVDQRTGHDVDDRLYAATLPARRGLAIALLVDVSGSTDAAVTSTDRVIDVAKVALLVASEAFDALGDLYGIFTFAGKGAHGVRVTTIKGFAERNGDTVRRRIAALEPGGFTRLGAAVRHATSLLARQSTGHRLLLVLSDGVPHDLDHYREEYAIEDSRHAISEARASGVYPFCLTIDREGKAYLSHVFGPAGHTILRQPEQLPTALLGVVRQLLRG